MLTALEPADGEAILPLALLKARVRVIASDEDGDIARMRLQAINEIERHSGCALGRRQFRWIDKQFCTRMTMPIGPIESVDEISYFTSDGTDTDLSPDDWYFGGRVIEAAPGKSWPYASGQAGSVRITFTAGFANAETEAPLLIAAVEVAVAALRASRDAPNFGPAKALADSYRVPGL